MSSHARWCGGRGFLLAATAAIALSSCAVRGDGPGPPAVPSPPVSSSSTTTTAPVPEPSPAPAQVADPVRVHIPAIGVEAPVIPLSIDAGGTLEAPQHFDEAGWNRDGPEPGEVGTAVIAGHVDSRTGPAVFFRLRDLSEGDPIHVHRADGTLVTFEVTSSAQYDKREVPSEQVYGATGGIELRLVTCGGEFDRSRRSYRDNLIVFASHVPGT